MLFPVENPDKLETEPVLLMEEPNFDEILPTPDSVDSDFWLLKLVDMPIPEFKTLEPLPSFFGKVWLPLTFGGELLPVVTFFFTLTSLTDLLGVF